mmetsp:Transcript_45567/g.73980  ORF Transcript_45567/g.73980 Transcript_45567/m.73980 type:complete len:939 (+) Transcript_45567:81-2897(+)
MVRQPPRASLLSISGLSLPTGSRCHDAVQSCCSSPCSSGIGRILSLRAALAEKVVASCEATGSQGGEAEDPIEDGCSASGPGSFGTPHPHLGLPSTSSSTPCDCNDVVSPPLLLRSPDDAATSVAKCAAIRPEGFTEAEEDTVRDAEVVTDTVLPEVAPGLSSGSALLALLKSGSEQLPSGSLLNSDVKDARPRSLTGSSDTTASCDSVRGPDGRCNSDGSIDSSSSERESASALQDECPPQSQESQQPTCLLKLDLWGHLALPILDLRHPKAFVGIDVFGGCSSMTPKGSRPQLLVDRRHDQDIMAMFKPSGWATCSTPHWAGIEGNLIRHVWRYFDAPTASPCHRLDKGTSGIVLCATSKAASRVVCQQILARSMVKQYIGLCHGVVPAAGAFSAPLALSTADRPLGACSTDGLVAVTRFRVLGYFRSPKGASFSLVQVQIDHGRQHQIRIHMASLGHPLVADSRYNASKAREDAEICPRLFLHACYIRCNLQADEPFALACHLPCELKHVLRNELSWLRDEAGDLSLGPGAQQLCECLLALEPEEPREAAAHGRYADLEELHATRLTVRRRDDFCRRFGFSSEERVQLIRILSKLPSSKDRSDALHKFRVLGQRTSDFIVARFGKYVDGLLRWHRLAEDGLASEAAQGPPEPPPASSQWQGSSSLSAAEEPSGSSELGPGVLLLDSFRGDPLQQVPGPMRILTEVVRCGVCGLEEHMVSLEAPSLSLRIRQSFGEPPPGRVKRKPPVRRRKSTRHNVNRLWVSAATWRGTSHNKEEDKEEKEEDEDEEEEEDEDEDDDEGEDEDEEVDEEEGEKSEEGDEDEEDLETEQEEWKEAPPGGRPPWIDPGMPPRKWTSRTRAANAKELQSSVRDIILSEGGTVDGIWLATKVSGPFNQWIRENEKRNDGSLKKWLCSLPGISVEHDGVMKSKWRVHAV